MNTYCFVSDTEDYVLLSLGTVEWGCYIYWYSGSCCSSSCSDHPCDQVDSIVCGLWNFFYLSFLKNGTK